MRARRAKKSKNKNLIIMGLITFFIGVIAITGKGTYAYFTAGEKILPAVASGTPVYNNFTINYTDHTESQVVDDGVTVYFDISGYLTADANWNSTLCNIYFFVSGGTARNSNFTNYSMKLRFDSISTINPTNLTKCYFSKSVNGTVTNIDNSLGDVTWSGCWLVYKITDPKFNLKAGETRNIIIHREGAAVNDQTANNLTISAGVKEVYIKAKAFNNAGGGSNSNYDWSKLEIKY